jgi:hypothetical protein
MKFAPLKKHMEAQEFEAALSEVDRLLAKESGSAYLWNLRGATAVLHIFSRPSQ